MERALVIGASGGIGAAVAAHLEGQGAEVVRLSRSEDGLEVTDARSVERHLGALEGPFDLIFVAVGILAPEGVRPEKSLSEIEPGTMAEVFAVNAIGPALILAHADRLLPEVGGRVGVLSARVGSIGDNGIGGWHSYRASKAALNQVVRGAAIEIGRRRREAVVVAIHPGTVETPFTAPYAGRHAMVPPEEAARRLVDVIGGLSPDQSGGFYAYDGSEVPW